MPKPSSLYQEASLDTLLNDPICRIIMQHDGLSPDSVRDELRSIARKLGHKRLVNGSLKGLAEAS